LPSPPQVGQELSEEKINSIIFKQIEEINNVIKKCTFKQVSDNEKKFGFVERKGKENFFRKGLVDEWKVVLKKDLIQKIEKEFYKEMRELKYL